MSLRLNFFILSNDELKIYFGKYIFYTLITLIAGAISFGICALLPSTGIGFFILKGIICLVVICSVYLLCYFKTKEFKHAYSLFVSLIKGFRGKNKRSVITSPTLPMNKIDE